jgi:hypothetical protein
VNSHGAGGMMFFFWTPACAGETIRIKSYHDFVRRDLVAPERTIKTQWDWDATLFQKKGSVSKILIHPCSPVEPGDTTLWAGFPLRSNK